MIRQAATSSRTGRPDSGHDEDRLRILYDAFWWRTGPQSGRVVVREILRAWRAAFPQDEFVLAVRKADRAAVQREFPDLETAVVRGRPHGIATLTQYAVLARRHRVDLAYTQNFAPPGVWTATFIHDVMYQTRPEWFTLPERLYYWLIPTFARRAGLVLTSSQHEVERIRRCNPKVGRVAGIGLSVSTDLVRATPVRPAQAEGLTSFLLTVGRLNIRKNLATTVLGVLDSGVLTPQRPLLAVGGEDGKAAEIPAEVRRAAEEGLVVFVPSVTDAELAWLYSHADLFLCLSLDEGFGLPPVEAAHFGCPVVVSDIEVFRENLETFATYVDPLDRFAVADAVRQTRTDRLAPPPFSTWEDCARRARKAIQSDHVRAKG